MRFLCLAESWGVRALLAAAVIGVSACTSPGRFRVDALARSDAQALTGTYRIVGDESETGQTPPHFEEIAEQVRAAMHMRGLVEARDSARPDIEVAVDFGVGPPRQIAREVMRDTYALGNMRNVHPPTRSSGRGSQVYVPTQSTGMTQTEFETRYETRLVVVGRQPESPRRDAPMREVWRVEVTSSDREADVERLIPQMVAAAQEFFGTNTGGRVEVKVDPRSVPLPETGR